MPVIKIGDRNVTVGDEFLKLSPEEQNATVEEITSSMTPPDASTSFGMGMGSMFLPADAMDQNRHAQANAAHPNAYLAGEVAAPIAALAAPVVIGARAAPALASMAGRAAMHYFFPGAGRAIDTATAVGRLARAQDGDIATNPIMRRIVEALLGRQGVARTATEGGGQGVRSGASPHERINSIADALRKPAGRTLTREEYLQRAATYTRRGASYQHRANAERDYPEFYGD